MSQQAKRNKWVDRQWRVVSHQTKRNKWQWGGGASRTRYIGSISTYIMKVYKSAIKKMNNTKGGGGSVADLYLSILWAHI